MFPGMGARVSGRGHYSSTTKRIFGRTDCRPHMPMEVGRQVGAGVRGRGRLCVLDLWYGVDAVRVLTYSMLLVRRERLGYARTPSRTCRTWGMGGSWQTFFPFGSGPDRVGYAKNYGSYVSVA